MSSSTPEVAGVALGAGAGTRLRPLTRLRPKVLCPVANRPLVDHALDRLAEITHDRAANVHAPHTTLAAHLAGRVLVSIEEEALGTAGALGALRHWIDGRPTVVVNGDTWCPGGLPALLDGWDGDRIRVLVAGSDAVGPTMQVAGALLPWSDVRDLDATPSGLWEVLWEEAHREGRLDGVAHHGPFVDCAGPADYLEANLLAAGGSAIGEDAVVEGEVIDSVVWDGARVWPGEVLRRAIRTDTGMTVVVRA